MDFGASVAENVPAPPKCPAEREDYSRSECCMGPLYVFDRWEFGGWDRHQRCGIILDLNFRLSRADIYLIFLKSRLLLLLLLLFKLLRKDKKSVLLCRFGYYAA